MSLTNDRYLAQQNLNYIKTQFSQIVISLLIQRSLPAPIISQNNAKLSTSFKSPFLKLTQL